MRYISDPPPFHIRSIKDVPVGNLFVLGGDGTYMRIRGAEGYHFRDNGPADVWAVQVSPDKGKGDLCSWVGDFEVTHLGEAVIALLPGGVA